MRWKLIIVLLGIILIVALAFLFKDNRFVVDSGFSREGKLNAIQEPDTIIIDQQTNQFLFNNDLFSMTISIQKNISNEWLSFPLIPFVNQIDSGHKYGLTDPNPSLGDNRYRLILESSRPIEEIGLMNYLVRLNQTSNCFDDPFRDCPTNDRRLVFEDICENFIFGDYLGENQNYQCTFDDFVIENELCPVLFNPQCEFSQNENKQILQIEFSSPVTDDGIVLIDPKIVFSTNDVEGIEMDVIDRDEYIIIWCDETSDDTTFAVFFTNGTVITSATDLDTNNGGCPFDTDNKVDVKIIDKGNTIAAGTWSDTTSIPSTTTFNYLTGGEIKIASVTSGRTKGLSLARLNNSRYIVATIDSSNQDVSVVLFNGSGIKLSEFDIDTNIGTTTEGIEVTSFTNDNQNFSVFFFDSDDEKFKFTTLEVIFGTNAITNVTPTIIVDEAIGTAFTGVLAIDSFDETRLVMTWVDDTAGIEPVAQIATYFKNTTVIKDVTVIETIQDVSTSISVSTVNSTAFVVSWDEDRDNSTEFELWDIDGNNLVDTIIAFNTTEEGFQEVLSTNTQDGICFNRFVIASSSFVPTVDARTKTYLTNGTIWTDGECEVCGYEGGNYDIDCALNCTQSGDINLDPGHNVSIKGIGKYIISGGSIKRYDKFELIGEGTSANEICHFIQNP